MKRRLRKSLPTLLLCFLVAAAVRSGAQQSNAPSQQPGAEARTRLQQRITKEVRHELAMLPYYSVFDNLAYRVDGDTVTLLGQVTHATLKPDAQAAIKNIEGVDKINNQIEVLPPSPLDDRLRIALFRAIYGSPSLQRYAIENIPPIHIIVKNGHATLEGVVDSEADKNVANLQANSVPGVFSVTNNLRVEK